MTREELDETMKQHYKALVRVAKKRCHQPEDAKDLVHAVYERACNGKEYEKVEVGLAKNWWIFKIREVGGRTSKRSKEVKQAEEAYMDLFGGDVLQDLSETEGHQVIEEYWKGLTRVQQCRMRQKFDSEGTPYLPCMKVKR